MGVNHSGRKYSFDANGEVNFDHFQILRAIGKGSFGKVCIVQKRDTRRMFAMKYMNKRMLLRTDAVRNVFREVQLLRTLDHPFLVNLWFTFQDAEDMFMVVDLLLGGDLRYHIQQDTKFDEERVKLYICEIGLALQYLQDQHVVHRDIKPDNILLDEEGHVHITDFNIATLLHPGQLATSMSGTKPYMAIEVFKCAVDECPGYSYAVDWWSLGVCAYEMLRGKRPYDIHSQTSAGEVCQMVGSTSVHYPSSWQPHMTSIVSKLLCTSPKERISTLAALEKHPYMQDIDFNQVLLRQIPPSFVPAKDHLNCDPTYELEEMIIEAKPLHKKKKRLAKQNSKRGSQKRHDEDSNGEEELDPIQQCLDNIDKEFVPYNREKELALQDLRDAQKAAHSILDDDDDDDVHNGGGGDNIKGDNGDTDGGNNTTTTTTAATAQQQRVSKKGDNGDETTTQPELHQQVKKKTEKKVDDCAGGDNNTQHQQPQQQAAKKDRRDKLKSKSVETDEPENKEKKDNKDKKDKEPKSGVSTIDQDENKAAAAKQPIKSQSSQDRGQPKQTLKESQLKTEPRPVTKQVIPTISVSSSESQQTDGNTESDT